MRNLLINYIKKDFKKKNIFFLTGDLGFSVLEPLKNISKKRFFNVGVSENNMMLLATGITNIKENLVYTYSISPFLILRNFEIIRNYISNESRNVRLIGVGAGVSYETMGKTHFNLDDINLIYSLKNITILNPANIEELEYVYQKFKNSKKPLYFRINKNNFNLPKNFFRKGDFFLKKGNKSNLICSGAVLNYVLKLLNQDEIKKLNIISLPILNYKKIPNLNKLLVKGKTLSICDSSKIIFFEEIKNKLVIDKKVNYFHNFDFDHNKIQFSGKEYQILSQMGLTRKNILKYLF